MDYRITFVRALSLLIFCSAFFYMTSAPAQGTRLLRQPTISQQHIAFIYGADLWVADRNGGEARRLTSTPAVESHPYFSPDGQRIAFTSNRAGVAAVYVVSINGGEPTRLTWYPAAAKVCGWTPDGKKILYASNRETAPTGYDRLWTVSLEGGPSTLLPAPWGTDGSFSPDGKKMVVDRVRRWDVEWRAYRGGQNTSLTILDLANLAETQIPCERTTDIRPVWLKDRIYFLSDRNWTTNVWSYTPGAGALERKTSFTGADVKWLSAGPDLLTFEREGYLHTLDPATGKTRQLEIIVRGDFPWAETKWEDVSKRATSASLSPTGKRALFEARGEIFTVPVENGDTRNLTRSSDAADRAPLWSPDGSQIAWFSDAGGQGYGLMLAAQDGLSEPRRISIGESKMAWEQTWSPDGKYIAFVDNDVRVRVIELSTEKITTVDTGGNNLERGSMGLTWSPDSRWLAYSKTAPNSLRRITVWSAEKGTVQPLTDPLADATSPAWDRDARHLYFLASTDVALGSGWANTSSMQADPEFGAYVAVLRKDDPSPFLPKSDEEPDTSATEKKTKANEKPETDTVLIDFERLDRRTLALPVPVRNYAGLLSGPKGSIFLAERVENEPGVTLKKFTLEDKKVEEFDSGVRSASVSTDGKKMLIQSVGGWKVVDTAKPSGKNGESLKVNLQMKLDRQAEWDQIFQEAWRYERDYFYDPGMHGRDWEEVRRRYAPLIPYIRHRSDLTYILDQVNGELSVGHSFVGGGDYPEVESSKMGVLGADLKLENGGWRFERIYTAESWNPNLTAPLDRPGIKVETGQYLVGVDGVELTANDDPYRLLDGTAGRQTVLHINDQPSMEGAWREIVEPIANESALQQRAWVEDNRRRVDELSDGKLAYVWVPNTGGPGFVSFNRYFFAQQDKQGAVIDERFNGGGLLDDYMVDLMTRRLRAAITNEAPNGAPIQLPAGILGPKVLLINELAGSGGDFFPWVFRQQKAGPLIGARTWGGLVKSSVHYAMVDGGYLTAPDNAVFDPVNRKWIGENEGIPPDIEVRQDARSAAEGRDVQLEKAVEEALRLLEQEKATQITPPPYPKPAAKSGRK